MKKDKFIVTYYILNLLIKGKVFDWNKGDYDPFDKISVFSRNPTPYYKSFTGTQEMLINIQEQLLMKNDKLAGDKLC